MIDAELLANPPVTFRRVMDILDHQDLDLLCDLNAKFGLIDLMLEGQEFDHLVELVRYLELVLLSPTITDQDLEELITRAGGHIFEPSARGCLEKLGYRAHQRLDAATRVLRPGGRM